jgi:pimeloyl-ACP methyl ester carboxylesterase
MEIQIGTQHWTYATLGKGREILIAFHGYGQDAASFRHLAQHLGDQYTFIAVDLASHGDHSGFEQEFFFDRPYAELWLEVFLNHLQRKVVGLIGFSIGARIAMFIASIMPKKISELWLLAPDGLPVSRAYRFLTSTHAGVLLFKTFVKHPGLAYLLIRLGSYSRLLSPKTVSFYLGEISTEHKRYKLLNTWLTYRKALPDMATLKKENTRGNMVTICVLGKRDSVIPLRKTRKNLRSALPQSTLFEADLGHNLLSEKAGKKISDLIGHKKSDPKSL